MRAQAEKQVVRLLAGVQRRADSVLDTLSGACCALLAALGSFAGAVLMAGLAGISPTLWMVAPWIVASRSGVIPGGGT